MSDYQKCEAHPACKFHKCDCHAIHIATKHLKKASKKTKPSKIKGFKIENGKIKAIHEKKQ